MQTSQVYLSKKRVVYIGRIESELSFQCARPILLISADDKIDLSYGKKTFCQSKSFLVPAGQNVVINFHGAIVVLCFLDILGSDFFRVSRQMVPVNDATNAVVYSDLACELDVARQAYAILSTQASASVVFKCVDTWLGRECIEGHINARDSRVVQAVALIQNTYSENTAVSDISQKLNLSVPRLLQLFKIVTGVSMRRFRLCHRIYIVIHLVDQGKSLTDAAIEAGFSDYSHFSRSFRKVLGLSPSDLKNNARIYTLQENSRRETCEA